MTACSQKDCLEDATVQYDHNGKIMYACPNHRNAVVAIFSAMGAFVPTFYPVKTKPANDPIREQMAQWVDDTITMLPKLRVYTLDVDSIAKAQEILENIKKEMQE